MAKAIAFATARHCPLSRRGGPKPPGQRPPRPRRALLARRVGRWPLCLPDLPVYRVLSRAAGGNAVRFLIPLERTNALPPLPWQGPSPLPQYHAAPCPAGGGQSPPASARPAPGGRFSPAGSGAGLCVSWTFWSTGHRPARAGETQVAFPVPAQKGNPCPRIGKSVPAAQAGGSVFEQPVGGVPKRGRLQGPLAGKQRTRPQAACATDHALSCVRQAARMPLAAPCQRRSDNRPDAPRADCKSCRAAVPPDTVGPPWSASVR